MRRRVKRFSAQWVENARTTPEFCARLKAALAHRTVPSRNVLVSGDALGYHGYLEYPGGTLANGFERCEAIADVLHDEFMSHITKYPPEFAVYVRAVCKVPIGANIISGAVFNEPGDKLARVRIQQNISRGPGFRAGLSAWLGRHQRNNETLVTFRFEFVSTGSKSGGRKRSGQSTTKTPTKARGRTSVGRGNQRLQRKSAVPVRGRKRRD